MRNRLGIILSTVAVLILSGCATTYHAGRNWDFIGERVVSDRPETDIIRVGRNEGSFRAIRFVVLKESVNIRDIRIEFENGRSQNIDVRRRFRRGSESRVIDLQGGQRRIERIIFRYEADSRGRRQALIRVYGLH